jgi:hypothetical protein
MVSVIFPIAATCGDLDGSVDSFKQTPQIKDKATSMNAH